MTRLGGWTFSQNFSSLALTVCDLWYYEDLEEKDDSLNELMNDKAVYRTAPATPGLLNIISEMLSVEPKTLGDFFIMFSILSFNLEIVSANMTFTSQSMIIHVKYV